MASWRPRCWLYHQRRHAAMLAQHRADDAIYLASTLLLVFRLSLCCSRSGCSCSRAGRPLLCLCFLRLRVTCMHDAPPCPRKVDYASMVPHGRRSRTITKGKSAHGLSCHVELKWMPMEDVPRKQQQHTNQCGVQILLHAAEGCPHAVHATRKPR